MISIYDIVSSPEMKAQVTFLYISRRAWVYPRMFCARLVEIGRPSGSGEVNEFRYIPVSAITTSLRYEHGFSFNKPYFSLRKTALYLVWLKLVLWF